MRYLKKSTSPPKGASPRKPATKAAPRVTPAEAGVNPKNKRDLLGSQGALAGVAVKDRKNRGGVTKSSLRRLARRGGCHRIKLDVYDEARLMLRHFLWDVLTDVSTLVSFDRRSTARVTDILFAVKRRHKTLYNATLRK